MTRFRHQPLIAASYWRRNQAEEFIALHDAIFPQTYANGSRIVEQLDADHRVFISTVGEGISGYVYATIEDETGEGLVDYFGVRESERGKGLGRQLLRQAMCWFFQDKHVPRVGLVVNDNLVNARSLYESAGFRLKYTGVHTRKEL